MRISLCMIVRNEAHTNHMGAMAGPGAHLRRAIESVQDFVDEVVIVDTGSTDGTQAIALEYADVFEEIAWTGFADARNRSMDIASGEVILVLDADEWVSEGHEFIREAARIPDFICGRIPVFNVGPKGGPVTGETAHQLRLFRNDPAIRWQHAIHNQIEDQVHAFAKKWMRMNGRAGALVSIGAQIVHLGYSLTLEESEAKYTPRLALLRDEIRKAAQERDRAYFQFQYALMLHMLRLVDESAQIWREIDFLKLNPWNRWYAHFTACKASLLLGDMAEALRHVDGMYASELMVVDGNQIIHESATHMMAGVVLIDSGDKTNGIKLLIQAYFESLRPWGMRCVLDPVKLLEDICNYSDEETAALLRMAHDQGNHIAYLRGLQMETVEIPHDIAEIMEA